MVTVSKNPHDPARAPGPARVPGRHRGLFPGPERAVSTSRKRGTPATPWRIGAGAVVRRGRPRGRIAAGYDADPVAVAIAEPGGCRGAHPPGSGDFVGQWPLSGQCR
ncbi:hypothetical protein L3i22_072650 [Actinoplanes sp. L3-i22]|nr:hypothetical protein L3i22_072650 [Actinoplanes sp. L3-i22]